MNEIICPHCSNDNGSLLDLRNQRREQIECTCLVCSKEFVHIFNVPKEKIEIPEIKK